MAISFNETFYLEQKLAQLQAAGEAGFETTADVQEAFAAAGLTAEAHYLQYGASEGLNPSADFDTNVYLDSKLAQLSTAGGFENITTREALATFLKDSGFSPLEHYNQHGAAEGVSPSAEFNAQAYLANKLADLQANDTDGTYADWTTDTLLAFFNDNGLTPLDHYTQFGRVENISPLPVEETSELTEALEGLLTAQANKVAFLEDEAAKVEAVADKLGNDPTPEQIEAAVGAVLDDTISAVNNLTAVGDISKARSDAYNQAIIDEQQSVNAERLVDAEAAAAKVEGLTTAVNAVLTAEAATKAAAEAQEETEADALGATAKFGSQNSGTATYAAPTAGETDKANVVALDGTNVISTDAEGKLIITEAGEALEGIDALFAAIQADYNAINAIKTAQGNEAAAKLEVAELENPDLVDAVESAEADLTAFNTLKANYEAAFTAYDDAASPSAEQQTALSNAYADLTEYDSSAFPAIDDTGSDGNADEIAAADSTTTSAISSEVTSLESAVTSAKNAVATASTPLADEMVAASNEVEAFDKAVNEYLAAKATADDLQGYNDAIDTAVENIEALDYVVDDNDVGSAENDVFIFSGEDATITGFGAQGDDVLYIGEGYAKVDLESSVDIAASAQGDASTLEVFFQQQGNDTVISLEGEAFDGSAKTAFEGNTIILSGVDADSLQYENGAVSIVEVA